MVPKKVLESVSKIFGTEKVSEKFGTGKKSRNRYWKKFVPEKSIGTGIGKIWYRKKVSEHVSEKFGTGTDFGHQNLGILKIYKRYR